MPLTFPQQLMYAGMIVLMYGGPLLLIALIVSIVIKSKKMFIYTLLAIPIGAIVLVAIFWVVLFGSAALGS